MRATTNARRKTDAPDAGPTSDRLIAAAERLFAENSYDAVSLRTIMAEARANVASAHYHFGSKEKVLEAIFRKHGEPMNVERHRLMDEWERRPGRGVASIRQLVRAFVGPAIRQRDTPEGRLFDRISAICSVDPNPHVREIIFRTFDDVGQRFTRLLRGTCEHLTEEEFYWRLHCLFGSMMYVRAKNGRVDHLVSGDPDGPSGLVLEQLVEFVAAGLHAPGRHPVRRVG